MPTRKPFPASIVTEEEQRRREEARALLMAKPRCKVQMRIKEQFKEDYKFLGSSALAIMGSKCIEYVSVEEQGPV
jgi:hypothetical protein